MARYIGSVCKLCRREGMKLFLKGTRCFTEKCAIERRNYSPGQHGQQRQRTRATEYSTQLREKQKVKRIYGILERQFRGCFHKAERQKGVTGENLLQILERRLDNVVYKLGFSSSRKEARQLVSHGHFLVNGKMTDIPSFLLKEGDIVAVKQKSGEMTAIHNALSSIEARGLPSWLELDKGNLQGKVKSVPTKEDISLPVNEQLVVEFYSR